MKMKMLTLVPLCFLIGWMMPADSMRVPSRIPRPPPNKKIPLSMVENSVDDMYSGCQRQMMGKVQTDYLNQEMKDRKFEKAWSEAAKCAAERKPRKEDKGLTKDHIQAICAFTGDGLYQPFNKAVLTDRPDYGTTFKFHSLHFLLTSAIQILNSRNHCDTSYRRSDLVFTGNVNEIVRFGAFASSSYKTNKFIFGNQTCFQVKTCHGAYLRDYSVYKTEEEVLIPPYETFRVAEVVTAPRVHKKLKKCKVVYELESVGAVSTLNCKAVNPQVTSASPSRFLETKEKENLPPKSFPRVITVD